MTSRTQSQIAAAIFLIMAIAMSVGLLVLRPEASEARNAALALNWVFWLLFVVIYPVSILKSGMVTGTEPVSISHRSSSPARYWVGFVTMTVFWIVIFVFVSILTLIVWYPSQI